MQDARHWLRESHDRHGKKIRGDEEAQSILRHLLKRRVMRYRRGKISKNPLHFLHDHCVLGEFCGVDDYGKAMLYPKACIHFFCAAALSYICYLSM